MKCCIIGCEYRRYYSKNISLHRLIRNGKPREDWLEAIRRLNGQYIDPSTVEKNLRICTAHFEKRYVLRIGLHNSLTRDAVPCIFPRMLVEGIENVEFVSCNTPDEPSSFPSTSDEIGKMNCIPNSSGTNVLSENVQLVDMKQLHQTTPSHVCAEDVKPDIVPQEPYESTTVSTLKTQNSALREKIQSKMKALKSIKQKLRRKNQKLKKLKTLLTTLE